MLQSSPCRIYWTTGVRRFQRAQKKCDIGKAERALIFLTRSCWARKAELKSKIQKMVTLPW